MAVHWYGHNPDEFIKYLQAWHDEFKITIWVTEFACEVGPFLINLSFNFMSIYRILRLQGVQMSMDLLRPLRRSWKRLRGLNTIVHLVSISVETGCISTDFCDQWFPKT